MKIGLNGLGLSVDGATAGLRLMVFDALMQIGMEQEFYFITNEEGIDRADLPDNCTVLFEKVHFDSKLAVWKWQNITLPGIIKKYGLQMLVSIDDVRFHNTKIICKHLLTKHIATGKLEKINKAHIAVTGQQLLAKMGGGYPLFDGIISNAFELLSYKQKQTVTATYTQGKDYFVNADVAITIPQFLNLLKAYSVFKKKQQSSWKLLCIIHAKDYTSFEDAIKNYKYKEEVVLQIATDIQERVSLIGAAYCLITVDEERANIPINEAFKCGVPVIAIGSKEMEAYYGDSVILADTAALEDIADKIIYIYKDENLGNGFVGKSLERGRELDTQKVLKNLIAWVLNTQ